MIGDDGVATVDSFQYPEAAESLLAAIRKLTPLPVRYLINTHYHIDHVAGNAVFQRAGAILVAQRNVLAWIRTENLKFYGADQRKERALVEGLPLPDLLVDQELTIRLGARRLELRARPGHTGGDLVVAVPDARVLFCGDLVWRRVAASLMTRRSRNGPGPSPTCSTGPTRRRTPTSRARARWPPWLTSAILHVISRT